MFVSRSTPGSRYGVMPGSYSFATISGNGFRAALAIALSVRPAMGEKLMPAAPTIEFSRTSRWATRSRAVQSPHRVGTSGPRARAVSQSACRSRRTRERVTLPNGNGFVPCPRSGIACRPARVPPGKVTDEESVVG